RPCRPAWLTEARSTRREPTQANPTTPSPRKRAFHLEQTMSQPDTELATDLGEDTLDTIAESMGDDTPEQDDLPDGDDAPEGDDPEGDDDGEQDQDDTPEPEGDDDDPEVEWTTNTGKTYRVKQSELRDGYMRQDDYQRK